MANLPRFDAYINGATVRPRTNTYFETINPYTSKAWAEVARCNEDDANAAVEAAYRAFTTGAWPAMNATQRGALLRRLGDLLAEHAQELAEYEVRDNGKLISEMGPQCAYIPQWYYYFGGLADKIEGSVLSTNRISSITRATNRWGWWLRSRRGTPHCCCLLSSLHRRSRPVIPS